MNRNNDYKRMNARVKRYGLPKAININPPTKTADMCSSPIVNTRNGRMACKTTASRCCYVSPERRDFTQSVGLDFSQLGRDDKRIDEESSIQFQEIYRDTSQVTSPVLRKALIPNNSFLPETLEQLRELKNIVCRETIKVENSSQCVQGIFDNVDKLPCKYVETYDGTKWHSLEDVDEIDKLLKQNSKTSKDIHISEVPRVRVIAEKFSKYKKNNVEVRRLEERLVCVEYDVYDSNESGGNPAAPCELLRAFFIVQPTQASRAQDGGPNITPIPSTVKHKYNISSMDLKKIEAEELEMIDAKNMDNRSYLENLKSVLKRKQIIHSKKNKNSLDLHMLYDIAKRDKTVLQDEISQDTVLTKSEFGEIKDYILHQTNSNITGITRRTLTKKETSGEIPMKFSQIIANELLEVNKQ